MCDENPTSIIQNMPALKPEPSNTTRTSYSAAFGQKALTPVPVKGGGRLRLPLHVQGVEVHVVESAPDAVLAVPLEAVDQGPGRVPDHVHAVYDDGCVSHTDSSDLSRQSHARTRARGGHATARTASVRRHSHFSASAMNLFR